MYLSRYIVCRHGTSKPVSHISRTITNSRGSLVFLNRSPMTSLRCLLRICGCQSTGSVALPVITTLIAPSLSSSECHLGRSALSSDDGLNRRPARLQALSLVHLFSLCRLLKAGVELRLQRLVQIEFHQTILVIDRNCCPILHRTLYVEDRNCVAKECRCAGVRFLNGRPCESDERSARYCIAHMSRKAINEVVLA